MELLWVKGGGRVSSRGSLALLLAHGKPRRASPNGRRACKDRAVRPETGAADARGV